MKFSNLKLKLQKIRFTCIWDGVKRAQYLKKHNILAKIGDNCIFQSRIFPMDPKLLKIHDNVTVAANVYFVTHDAIRHVLNYKYKKIYQMNLGPIEIMDNVFVGLGSIIMPNVKINQNVIIAAGSVVTKDVPANSIVGGVPARVLGSFDEVVKKRKIEENTVSYEDYVRKAWEKFYKDKKE